MNSNATQDLIIKKKIAQFNKELRLGNLSFFETALYKQILKIKILVHIYLLNFGDLQIDYFLQGFKFGNKI